MTILKNSRECEALLINGLAADSERSASLLFKFCEMREGTIARKISPTGVALSLYPQGGHPIGGGLCL
jgi:hypothetical protein